MTSKWTRNVFGQVKTELMLDTQIPLTQLCADIQLFQELHLHITKGFKL